MTEISIFEIIMLIAFGSAWPFSIIKSYRSRQIGGKSIVFLWVVLIGYAAGVIHKLQYNLDKVIFLYLLNSVMVSIDIALYYRNRWLLQQERVNGS